MNMIPGIHNKTIKIRSTNVWDHSHIPQHDPIFFFQFCVHTKIILQLPITTMNIHSDSVHDHGKILYIR